MEVVVSIVVIIFGVFQICLIFKLWGMANNVKMLKEKEPRLKSVAARVAYLRGDKDLAQRLLDEHFFMEARDLALNTAYPFNERYTKLVDLCRPLYQKMSLRAPDFEKYRDKELLLISASDD